MYNVDVSSFWAYINTLLSVVAGVLSLDPQVFISMRSVQSITGISLGVVVIAGLMRMLGQSIVLFANRVRPAGFIVRILASTLEFVLDVLVMGVLLWLIVHLLKPDSSLSLVEILRTIPLAYAPYWLGALVLVPYLGIWIERGLKVYVFLALTVAFHGAFGLQFYTAVISALIAWLLVFLLDSLLSWPLTSATENITQVLAKNKEDGKDIYQEVYQIFISVSEPNTETNRSDGGRHT